MDEALKRLLIKYMDGQCTEEEFRQIEAISRRPGMDKVWAELVDLRSAKEWDTEVEVDQEMQDAIVRRKDMLFKKIAASANDKVIYPNETRIRGISSLYYAAACVVLFLFVGLGIWRYQQYTTNDYETVYTIHSNERGAPIKYILPDGSQVFLGAGSSFSYPEEYPKNGRMVRLEGEAFFDVVSDPQNPFTIQTGDVNTRVLGTSFKITAFDGTPVEVAVATGKVRVSSDRDAESRELAMLTPGMKIRYDSETDHASIGKADVYTLRQWAIGEIVFDEQQMAAVAIELKRRYGIEIEFANKEIANRVVGGTFEPNEPIDNVINILSVVGEFTYKKVTDKKFIIQKPEKK